MDSKERKAEIDVELLNKYFHHKCNKLEKERVLAWFKDAKSEKHLRKILQDRWEEIPIEMQGYEIDSSRVFNSVFNHIHMTEWKKERNKTFLQKITANFSKIAAILFLPFLIYSGWNIRNDFFSVSDKTSYAEIFSPLGARTHFELPDGTTGWLNSGSTLKFPVKFHGSNRLVFLSGEGYFEVIKNSKKPFVVKTGNIEVMALGTRFNILDYADDKTMNVILESGKVVVNVVCSNKKVKRITELVPDQKVIIQKDSLKFIKRKVDSRIYTSWRKGMLIFRNEPMHEVINRLERWYNVDIDLMDEEIENYQYRATFENEELDEVLSLIKLSSPVYFVQEKRVRLPDGTFTKKKIKMFIKPEFKGKI